MKALVLSGGSSKSAFQVGALSYIIGELGVSYDIFCGVSAGSINASFLSMFPYGQEKMSISLLSNLWSKLDNSSIYKRWFPFGKLHVLWKHSFFDSSPLHNLIKKEISQDKILQANKQVSVGTVSLSSGKYTYFDQNSEHFIDAVIASSSFPGIFSPVRFLNQLWIDGGIKTMSPIQRAIDLGATEIDIIVTYPHTRINKFFHKPNIINILKRAFDLATDKISDNDLKFADFHNTIALANLSNKKYVKINVLRPEFNLLEDLLDFSPNKIQEMMEKGYNYAKRNYNIII